MTEAAEEKNDRTTDKKQQPARKRASSTFDGDGFPLTELGNAERMLWMFPDSLRYCAQLGWLVYDGVRWAADERDEAVTRYYQYSVRDAYDKAGQAKKAAGEDGADPPAWAGPTMAWCIASESNGRRSASLEWASRQMGVTVRFRDLDRDIFLLNVKNGTIDLRTGNLLPHDRAHMITRLAPVEYDPDAQCPLWTKCLETWLPGDPAVDGDRHAKVKFAQRSFGYSLTGSTGAETAFFLYGSGRNGKSKFVGALESILGYTGEGGYAARIPFAALSDEKKGGGVTPELVSLVGARFVIASEPAVHHRFNDALIKDLTGSDRITVNPKHKAQFEFLPQFKLWIYGNHKPRLNSVDDGMKARLPLVPFTVTIPAEDRDPNLDVKLQAEAPGILAWAVRGCLEWQREGLNPPASVVEATSEYHIENDPFAGFFEECIDKGEGMFATMGEIMSAYKSFAAVSDDVRMPHQNAFAERLRAEGAVSRVKRVGSRTVRGWDGIEVKPETIPDEQAPPITEGVFAAAGGRNVTPVTPVTPVTRNSETLPRARARGSDLHNIGVTTVTGVTGVTEVTEDGKTPPAPDDPVLLPVSFKSCVNGWHVDCVDHGVPPDRRGLGYGEGRTKLLAIDDALSDPFCTDLQRLSLDAEKKRLEGGAA